MYLTYCVRTYLLRNHFNLRLSTYNLPFDLRLTFKPLTYSFTFDVPFDLRPNTHFGQVLVNNMIQIS